MPDCFFANVFAPDTCARLVAELRSLPGAPATVHGRQAPATVETAIRRTTRVVASPATRDLVRRGLLDHQRAIEEHFGLGLGEPEEAQFLRYEAGDYFVAHQDGNSPLVFDDSRWRRISVVLFLNAQSESAGPGTYGGGALVLHGRGADSDLRSPITARPGTLVAFRSETTHEVTPVTHGERYTVASWYPLGQEWRARSRGPIPGPAARTAVTSPPTAAASALLARIVDFVRSLGIEVTEAPVHRATLVPGIDIRRGGLVVDAVLLCKPADLLHEAAHIALKPAAERAALDGTLDGSAAEELAAIAWTWAAALHLRIDPGEVFHDEVISGNGPTLLANFSAGHYVGVPMLRYWGMTRERSGLDGVETYPHMLRWTRDG